MKVQAKLAHMKCRGTRHEIKCTLSEAQEMEENFNETMQDLLSNEKKRIEMENFLKMYNAGKPLGYFQVPSFMTGVEKLADGI